MPLPLTLRTPLRLVFYPGGGTARTPVLFLTHTNRAHFNLSYFCPGCNRVWANAEIFPRAKLFLEVHPCPSCGGGGSGSFMSYTYWNSYPEFLKAISGPLLHQEFLTFSSDPDRYLLPGV